VPRLETTRLVEIAAVLAPERGRHFHSWWAGRDRAGKLLVLVRTTHPDHVAPQQPARGRALASRNSQKLWIDPTR
jgi:hypothetical protein